MTNDEVLLADGETEDWLAGADTGGEQTSGLTVERGEAGLTPASPWAVKLDQWGKRRGNELAETDEFKAIGVGPEDAADLYGMSFEMEPELVEHCANPNKKEFLEALLQDPDYQALHNETNLDVVASELASLKYGEEYSKFAKLREKQQKQDQKNGNTGPLSPKDQLKRDMEAMSAAQKAVKQAQQDVQDLRDMQEAVGIGKEDGGGGKMSSKQLKKTFQKLRNDQNLRQICEMAGKYRMLARSRQRNKVIHGYDDMVGIELGNDLSRILSQELAMMNDEDLEMDTLRRFAERQTLCYEYRGIQKVAKGPIIFCIDESGSMSGPRIQNAKAMALAMAWVAKSQNRWCGMVGWSSHNQVRWIALPPKNWPTGELLDWLGKFFDGGTHIPIEKMPDIYAQLGAQKGKTDIIIITDGEASNNPASVTAYQAWKKEVNAKSIGITIGAESFALQEISDEYYRIASLSVEDEAVGKALSV